MANILTAVFDVFSEVGAWFVEFIPTIIGIFYTAEAGLTFLGVLAVVSLGISIIFLVMGLIQNFLHFRG